MKWIILHLSIILAMVCGSSVDSKIDSPQGGLASNPKYWRLNRYVDHSSRLALHRAVYFLVWRGRRESESPSLHVEVEKLLWRLSIPRLRPPWCFFQVVFVRVYIVFATVYFCISFFGNICLIFKYGYVYFFCFLDTSYCIHGIEIDISPLKISRSFF